VNASAYPTAAPVRGAADLARLEQIDRALLDLARALGAEPVQFPALIARAALERAEYPQAFPHLLMAAASAHDPAIAAPALLAPANLAEPAWCLSPAVCYHVYAQLAGQRLDGPRVVTARGRCFRHEATTAPGVRQIEFEMREIVLLGPAGWVADAAVAARARLTEVAAAFRLAGDWEPAADPFFLPAAAGKAAMQRLAGTKDELCCPHPAGPVAAASVNRHGSFFGDRFAITDPAGRPIHTACAAVGLDRWMTCATDTRTEVTR